MGTTCPCAGDCLQVSAALASGLAARIADELSGTVLLQLEAGQDMLDFKSNADTDVGENRQVKALTLHSGLCLYSFSSYRHTLPHLKGRQFWQ